MEETIETETTEPKRIKPRVSAPEHVCAVCRSPGGWESCGFLRMRSGRLYTICDHCERERKHHGGCKALRAKIAAAGGAYPERPGATVAKVETQQPAQAAADIDDDAEVEEVLFEDDGAATTNGDGADLPITEAERLLAECLVTVAADAVAE